MRKFSKADHTCVSNELSPKNTSPLRPFFLLISIKNLLFCASENLNNYLMRLTTPGTH